MTNPKSNIRYKIFIVEDNKLYAQVLKKQLVDNHYQVRFFIQAKTVLQTSMINPM
jgi:two-component system, NtrC family, response regulator AtoC